MKNKKLFNLYLLGTPVMSIIAFCQTIDQKPNIVLILADDMQMDH